MNQSMTKKYMKLLHYALLMGIVLAVVIELTYLDDRTQTSKLEQPVLDRKGVIRINRTNALQEEEDTIVFRGKEVIVKN